MVSFTTQAVEKPSEIFQILGALRPEDILRMKMMNPHRKVEYLRNIFGRETLEYAKHQYKLLTGEQLQGNRKTR